LMDRKPFLEFNVFDFDEDIVEELKKFSKTSFDLENILATAKELKYTREIVRILGEQWNNPSDNFVTFFTSQVYSGRRTKTVMEQFSQVTRTAFRQFVNYRISDSVNRIKYSLTSESALPSEEISKQAP